MDKNTEESSNGSDRRRRPPFTMVDWIIAAFSIVLLIYIIINLPPF